MFTSIKMINTSRQDVMSGQSVWASLLSVHLGDSLKKKWNKNKIKRNRDTDGKWLREGRNQSDGREGKKNRSFEMFKKGFFFFQQTLCRGARNINQYSRHGCRALNASLSAFAFQAPGFRRNLHSANFIQRALLIVHRCLAWRTMSLSGLKTRWRPCCLRAFQKKGAASHWENAK